MLFHKMLRSPLHKLARALPIFCWLSTYNSEIALADLIAGITVGLTLISQSIVYAALADLPPQYGLYSSLIGGFVYAVFGTVPALSIAPTAILSLLTFTYTSGVSFGTIEATSLLCFYSGIIEVCCGLLNLGFVADFISTPVVVGVTSAAAVLITLTQLISIFGLPEPGTRTFVGLWKHIFWNISNINTWDTALGIVCCCFLFILSRLQSQSLYKEREKTSPTFKRLKTFFWFLSISRNLLLILTSVGLAYILSSDDGSMFSLPVSDIRPNFPSISLPQFNIIKNNTTLSFLDMTKELGIGIFVIPFMAIVANAAIAKSFMQYNVLDGSQEMLALGICNIIGSCVGAMPVSGSFSRSAINQSSGVRSPVSGIYTGLIIVSSFIFLMPVFSYIPKAAISSVTVCALSVMLSLKLPKKIWELNKVDIETYQLISTPVVVGVTSAAAVLITLTQLISIFGLPEPGTRTFVGLWKHIFWNISNINTWDTALGIFCCCFLFILSRLQSQSLYKEREKTSPTFKRLKTFFWFLSISRNLLLILTSVGLAYILSSDDGSMFSLPEIDVLPLLITFFASLFLIIEVGILIGIAVNILILLYYISRPQINLQKVTILGKEYIKIIPLGSVFYPSVNYLRKSIMENEICIDKFKEGNVIIIDCSKLVKTDFTMAKTIGALAHDLQKSDKSIAFLKLTPTLSKLVSKTCRNCIFAFTDDILFEILKERRYSDILDCYKNIKVEPRNIAEDTFSVVTRL